MKGTGRNERSLEQLDPVPRSSAGLARDSSTRSLTALVFGFVFLAAFLSFLVQPLAARFLLPRFGGGSSVWTICLVFFQATLTLGYAYAHFVARVLPLRQQPIVHGGLLLLSALTIPILSDSNVAASASEDPALLLLAFLFRQVGLPFLLLCGTSPLVQSWFAHVKGGAAYRLYGISNFGSLLGLLAYPFLLEPLLGLKDQSVLWSALYIGLVLVSLGVWRAFSRAALQRPALDPVAESNSVESTDPKHPLFARLMWLAIPAFASVLLIATSSRITQDIAPVPLLWVLPIGLYLMAFALAFSAGPSLGRAAWIVLAAVGVTASVWVMHLEQDSEAPEILVRLAVYMATIFFLCRALFGELYLMRPPATRLTGYYLTISIGGALGGCFVGLLAPRIFNGYWELPIAYWGSAFLIALSLLAHDKPKTVIHRARAVMYWIAALTALEVSLLEHSIDEVRGAHSTRRGFYGVLSIYERGEDLDQRRTLYHGNICHGVQYVEPIMRKEPTTYYARQSGMGRALSQRSFLGRRVGAIGLGTGTIAAYGEPGDFFRFYEIDPLVATIAAEDFRYIRESEAQVEVVLGDARVSLQRELDDSGSNRYDYLIVDAFSGDAIPVHLLTREAFELYWNHLEPGGVLLIHTSNRYVELAPVARALAHERGLESIEVCFEESEEEDEGPVAFGSDWVVITRDPAMLALFEGDAVETDLEQLEDPMSIWTDDHSYLLHAMELW